MAEEVLQMDFIIVTFGFLIGGFGFGFGLELILKENSKLLKWFEKIL